MPQKNSSKTSTPSSAQPASLMETQDDSFLDGLIYSYLRYGRALSSKKRKQLLEAIKKQATLTASDLLN